MTDVPDNRFIEVLGGIAQAEGLPRIAGQILGYLVLAGDARSLTEIAEALGVSKASVSTNVRLLEARGSAVRSSRRGSRQDHWRAADHPHHRVLSEMSERFRRNADQIQEVAEIFPPNRDEDRRKVTNFALFYRRSADFLRDWARNLQENETRDIPGAQKPAEQSSD